MKPRAVDAPGDAGFQVPPSSGVSLNAKDATSRKKEGGVFASLPFAKATFRWIGL